MEIMIRNEKEEDYREVEHLTREAFWNQYIPGAREHYVLHVLRKSKDFIKELDFVAEVDHKIVGSIVYSESKLIDDGLKTEIISLTLGPIAVHPDFQKKKIGAKLIEHSIEKARAMGYSAIMITGDPRYYHQFGFRCAERYNIAMEDGKYAAALMVLPLQDEDIFDRFKGRFIQSSAFSIDEKELEKFDQGFPKKEKKITESQKMFELLSSLIY